MSDGGMSSNDLRADATRGLALVLSNYTFSCDGILQQWSIHWEIKDPDRCEIIVDFHVLRPTKTPGFCGLLSVGMHREVVIPTQTPRPYRTVDSFKTNSSVRVEAGDVVGLVVMFNNSRRCRLGGVSILKAREPSDPGLVYLARPASQEELTTDEWRLETLTGFGCDDCSSDGRTHSRTRTRTTDSDREERLPPGTPIHYTSPVFECLFCYYYTQVHELGQALRVKRDVWRALGWALGEVYTPIHYTSPVFECLFCYYIHRYTKA